MHPPGTPQSEDAALHQLWRQVCASRGTLAPDPALLGGFMAGLGTHEREKLQSVLLLAARGREPPGELSLISWAAACTRPALFDQLAAHGLAFTGAGLFACGLKLREEGWDMQQRLAQLQSNPGDVDTLRAWLPAAPREPEAVVQSLAPSTRQAPEDDGEAFNPWLDHGPLEGNLPDWHEEPVGDVPPMPDPLTALPVLPTRFARQRPDALPSAANAAGAPPESRLRLRLFGKSAAHTLEVTPTAGAAILWACTWSASTRPMP